MSHLLRSGFRLKLRVLSWFFLAVLSLYPCLFGSSEIIDRIAAVVNTDVITLSDLRIVMSFGLHDDGVSSRSRDDRAVLERLINQKLVIGLTKRNMSVRQEEVEAAFLSLVKKQGRTAVETLLTQFGLDEKDLQEYLVERILYQKIIQERFGLATIVSLKEMEDFYRQNYIPAQEAKGLVPDPMMEILDELELAIKTEKINRQVEEWLITLKRGADIQILLEEEGA